MENETKLSNYVNQIQRENVFTNESSAVGLWV